MSDLREILGIQAPKAPTGPVVPGTKVRQSQGPPPMEPKAKRPRLSREVMSLKTSFKGAPQSMMPAMLSEAVDEKKQFKAKIVLGTKRVSKWEKRAFKNPVRTDTTLVFHHWQKSKRLEESYKFAKFNRKLSIPIYNDAEYNAHFKSDQWSREETDYLFKLCNDFDLRFIVIADRWQPPENAIKTVRSVEEIKDRYYTIQRGLVPLRKGSDQDDSMTSPLLQHPYDPVRETERKRQQNQQSHRTAEDVALETEVTTEVGRIESTFRKHSEDALKYLRLIKKQQKYYSNLKQERYAYQAAKDLDERNKGTKRGHGSAMDVDGEGPQKITRRHPAAYSRVHAKAYTATLVPLLNQQKYAPLFAKALPELQMDQVPRTSFIFVAAITELRCDLLLLHELQRLHAEKAFELEVLRAHHKALQERLSKNGASSSNATSSTPSAMPTSSASQTPPVVTAIAIPTVLAKATSTAPIPSSLNSMDVDP